MRQDGTVVTIAPGLLTAARALLAVAGPAGEVTHTPAEAAGVLQVDRSTVYRAIKAGALAARRIGRGRGQLRIPDSALQAYLNGIPAAPSPASAEAVA